MHGLQREGNRLATGDTWAVPADGSGAPTRLIPDALSAGVAR